MKSGKIAKFILHPILSGICVAALTVERVSSYFNEQYEQRQKSLIAQFYDGLERAGKREISLAEQLVESEIKRDRVMLDYAGALNDIDFLTRTSKALLKEYQEQASDYKELLDAINTYLESEKQLRRQDIFDEEDRSLSTKR